MSKCRDCGNEYNGFTDVVIVCGDCHKKRERWKVLAGLGRQALIDIILKLEFEIKLEKTDIEDMQNRVDSSMKRALHAEEVLQNLKNFTHLFLQSYLDNKNDINTMARAQELCQFFNEVI